MSVVSDIETARAATSMMLASVIAATAAQRCRRARKCATTRKLNPASAYTSACAHDSGAVSSADRYMRRIATNAASAQRSRRIPPSRRSDDTASAMTSNGSPRRRRGIGTSGCRRWRRGLRWRGQRRRRRVLPPELLLRRRRRRRLVRLLRRPAGLLLLLLLLQSVHLLLVRVLPVLLHVLIAHG